MSDILGISSNAISAYQRALSTVSNNIANVNTEGYSHQDVVIKDSAPQKLGSMYIGTGAMVDTIKRQFDAFAESNLRESTSDLSSQKPVVDYTKRVMDIMGDSNIGLSSALDTFFSSASALSADPASTVLRSSFLNNASGVGSRLGELSNQLNLITTETRQALDGAATQVNTLTNQLALINQRMNNEPTSDAQPAELMDARDLALRKLSDLVRIKVTFATNGAVSVGLGATTGAGLIVQGNKSRAIGINNEVKEKVEIVIDPYGSTETLPGFSGGQIGGYQNLISQVLIPTQQNLNSLAKTFVVETNKIQQNGIDANGKMGQNLYTIDPTETNAAAAVRVAFNDPMLVATAAQFRVSEGGNNVSTTQASVAYYGSQPKVALSNSQIVNNPSASSAVSFKVDGANEYVPVSSVSAGVKATFYLDEAAPNQQLQVLTRDGRQLLGQALTETQKYQLLNTGNGFEANANYSSQYLNQSGGKAYRGLDLFYGAKAVPLQVQTYDKNGVALPLKPIPAVLQTDRISGIDSMPAGALTLNGVSLPAYVHASGTTITIAGLKTGSGLFKPDFSFAATVNGQVINLTIPSGQATDVSSVAVALNTSLANYGMSATTVNSGKDILVRDMQGRNINGVSLSPIPQGGDVMGASSGDIRVESPANSAAAWINGVTTVVNKNVQFGIANNPNTPSFNGFNLGIGGVNLHAENLTAINLPDLAMQIQDEVRQQDNSTNISVNIKDGNLVITDLLGRAVGNFNLSTNPGVTDASVGQVSIENSTVSQTHIRAQTFSEIAVPTGQINFKKPLALNGQMITDFTTLHQLVDAINNSAAGLVATLRGGDLVVTDPQGANIQVSPTQNGNALDIHETIYPAQIRLVQEVRDLRISAASLNFNKPLQINGINLSQASYPWPTNGTSSFSSNFGDIGVLSGNNLQDTLNDKSSIGLNGVDFGNPFNLNAYDSFSVNVAGKKLTVSPIALVDISGLTPTQNLAQTLQAGLQQYDSNIAVTTDVDGHLVVSDMSTPKRELNNISLSTSSDGLVAKANRGKVDLRFADSFKASVTNGKLVVTALSAGMTDVDIANALGIKSDGLSLVADTPLSSITDLVQRFNDKQGQTGVSASLDANSDLVISVTDPYAQRSISIGPGKDAYGNSLENILGLGSDDYDVNKRLQAQLPLDPNHGEIRLSFGSFGKPPLDQMGTPYDLSKLGLRTAAYVEGGSPDDLLVFVTGKGLAKVSAGFDGQPDNPRDSLRGQSLLVKFTATDRYSIIDKKTGTVLADRNFDPTVIQPVINFQGLQIKLTRVPSVGDTYQVDGNSDGFGNNVNMLDMVDLNKKPVLDGKTIATAYIDQINNVGNLSQQANINQQALTVVNTQAIAARDKVSGVNLDQEAADLIRFQQAYQASAKALQISGQLFDAINQIR